MQNHPLERYHFAGKEIAWSIVTVAFAIIFFMVLHLVFSTPVLGDRDSIVTLLSRIIFPLIMFSAFLGAFAIHAMIVPTKMYRYVVSVLVSASVFLFFQPSIWSALAAIVTLGTLITYHATVKGDMVSRISVRPIYSVAAGLGTVVLALLAVVSLLYYSSFASRPHALDELRISLRDSIVDTTITLVKSRSEGFSGDLTLDQVIANYLAGRINVEELLPQLKIEEPTEGDENFQTYQELKNSLAKQADGETAQIIDDASMAQKQILVDVATEQLSKAEQDLIASVRNELIASLGIDATGDSTIREVLQKFADRRILSVVDPYIKWAPAIFAVSLFFVLYIFSFLYRYLTRGFGLLWFGVLRVSHFIFIKEVDVKAKRISLEM